jgi:hypothetical protein
MLKPIGNVTGFDFHVWQEDAVVTITTSSGRVFFESGRHIEYGPKSHTVRARPEARRVRIYITEESACLWEDVDETPRGAYPGGLIVLGHVEIPAVTDEAKSTSQRPKQQQRHQEEQILRVIKNLGHDPMALPKTTPGKSGIKSAVRNELPSFQVGVFNKAWERLRSDGAIKDA